METHMKKILVKSSTAIAISLLLSTQTLASPSHSEEKSNEAIGFGSGVLLGTAIAGPLGGMVAGIFGLLIADDINSDKKLARTTALVKQKDQDLIAMQQQVNEAQIKVQLLMAAMDKTIEQSHRDIATSVQFKTASSLLEAHYKNELSVLAAHLRENPKLTVSLAGYADQRGDSDYNQGLSEQRALSVKNYLVSQGVQENQVLSQFYGESQLVSGGNEIEDNFFDRRVSLKVTGDSNSMTAAHP